MDLLQLEHFLAVAEEGSFTRAAERVFRTQPAVSQSVKKIESEIGVQLFARDMPDLTLTEAGASLLEYARRILQLRDDAVKQVSRLHDLDTGHLTIAAHESAALYVLPGPLRQYFHQFPHIKIRIVRGKVDDIPRHVMDREIDIGFVKGEPAFHGLKSAIVHADAMILIASPRHPITSRGRLRIKDLDNEPFVVHHLCNSTEQQILRLFDAHGIRCNIVAELWSFENIRSFVQQGIGLAIVPRVTVLPELTAGTLVSVPLEDLDIPRRTIMVFRDRGYMSDAAQQFIDIVRKFKWENWVSAGRSSSAVLVGARPGGPAALKGTA